MKRAIFLAALLALLGCEPVKQLSLTLPDGIERESVVLEVAVYVAATPNITCGALEMGVINALQILPARVLLAGVDETTNVGSIPRNDRRLIVANALDVETNALVAKGCAEVAARQVGPVALPLLETIEARLQEEVTVVARVTDDEVSYEIFDEDGELSGDTNVVIDMFNLRDPGDFIDVPVRVTVFRDGTIVFDEVVDQTAGRFDVRDLGIDQPGFYGVELRPRWSTAPLELSIGAFVIEPVEIASLDGSVGTELTLVGGTPGVITRVDDVVGFTPVGGATTEVTVDPLFNFLGSIPNEGAVFEEPGVALHFVPSDGAPAVPLPAAIPVNQTYKYPVLALNGCDEGRAFVVMRQGIFAFLDTIDLDASTLTLQEGAGGLPIVLGPSACIAKGDGETRVGLAQSNVLGVPIVAAVSGELFLELEAPVLADYGLLTPTTLSPLPAIGRSSDGAALLATPDFEGVSVSAYTADLDEQLLVRQREPMVIPALPRALAGGEVNGALDVALSHLGGTRARLDIARDGIHTVLPLVCDEPPAIVTAPPLCQLRVGDVDDDGADEIVILRVDAGVPTVEIISLDL